MYNDIDYDNQLELCNAYIYEQLHPSGSINGLAEYDQSLDALVSDMLLDSGNKTNSFSAEAQQHSNCYYAIQPQISPIFDQNSSSSTSSNDEEPKHNIFHNSFPKSRASSIDSDTLPQKPRIPKSHGHRSQNRRGKIWEFLIKLLQNHDTCPRLIKWYDYNKGWFKFVQSNGVARFWGLKAGNNLMTYEKFSRAMRYHYKEEYLLPVKGKRLVYSFGPKAKGWRSPRPILD